MQCGVDQLVGDIRTVELGRVDVVDAGLDGPAQHGQGRRPVGRRSEDAGTGELHGAEPDPVNRTVGQEDGVSGHRPILVSGASRSQRGAVEEVHHDGGHLLGVGEDPEMAG